ncbi:MAG: hypothetical protein EBV15_11030 [Bacteroidetes bacterium]|nr:hypothetical protein [Bacteroidota bacterium]
MKIKNIKTMLLSVAVCFLSGNILFGQNTPKKGEIIVEKTVKNKRDSSGKITETKITKRIKIDSSSMELIEEVMHDSLIENLKTDTINSIISLWPNNNLIVINNDTIISSHKNNNKSPLIITNGGMQMGFATLQRPNIAAINAEFPELINSSSLHFGFNSEWGVKTFSGKWRLWSGIQYDIMNYRFSNSNVRLLANQPVFNTQMDSANNSAKSKIVVNYIGIPFSFGYQSKAGEADEGFRIRAGIMAGYRVRTHTKVKLDNDKSTKDFDDFNMNDFMITPFVQMSYNDIGLYFRYNTSQLFKDNQGTRYTGMQFGLVFQ